MENGAPTNLVIRRSVFLMTEGYSPLQMFRRDHEDVMYLPPPSSVVAVGHSLESVLCQSYGKSQRLGGTPGRLACPSAWLPAWLPGWLPAWLPACLSVSGARCHRGCPLILG